MRPLPDTAGELAAVARWSAWLHALWGDGARLVALEPAKGPAVDAGAPRPILSRCTDAQRMLHLPLGLGAASGSSRWGPAAAAHAAAHWRFGGPPQPRAGLKPVQLALFGVLEDARVETVALQELPGLRALWLPFHEGLDAPAGMHFEALLARLARSLLDPAHQDPHPWVARARAMFFDRDGKTLALPTPADVRIAASQLGNDIGQMRLPFNPRSYRVHAVYRDDNHHLWLEDESLPASEQALTATIDDGGRGSDAQEVHAMAAAPVCYPEWDHRIARYRPDWSQVFETTPPPARPARSARPMRVLQQRLTRALGALRAGPPRASGRAAWGDDFHPAALVDARVDQRLRRTPDDRIYRRLLPLPARLSVVLLVDASASSGAPGPDGFPLLDCLLGVAQACAGSLEAAGHGCAVLAFASRTRHRVELLKLKDWTENAAGSAVAARCCALQAGGSTRSGSAVRHATARVLAHSVVGPAMQPRLLLLGDGEPHDVDVHDPAYLRKDLRRALAEAASQGVVVRSVPLPLLRRSHGLADALAGLLTGPPERP